MQQTKSSTAGARTQSWLWPDHAIGKRESRKLREEHNALVNINAELLQTLKDIQHNAAVMNQAEPHSVFSAINDQARAGYRKSRRNQSLIICCMRRAGTANPLDMQN